MVFRIAAGAVFGAAAITVTYSGALVSRPGRTTGTAFNAASVTRRVVGTMTLATGPGAAATLSYSVDGVSVQKQVTRFTFRKNDFTGSYLSHFAADTGAAESLTATVDDGGSSFLMQTTGSVDAPGSFSAPVTQMGHLRIMNGTFSCTSGAAETSPCRTPPCPRTGSPRSCAWTPHSPGASRGVRLGNVANWP
jgi:hypothetical protein